MFRARTHVLGVILIVVHGRQGRDLDDFALGYEGKLPGRMCQTMTRS